MSTDASWLYEQYCMGHPAYMSAPHWNSLDRDIAQAWEFLAEAVDSGAEDVRETVKDSVQDVTVELSLPNKKTVAEHNKAAGKYGVSDQWLTVLVQGPKVILPADLVQLARDVKDAGDAETFLAALLDRMDGEEHQDPEPLDVDRLEVRLCLGQAESCTYTSKGLPVEDGLPEGVVIQVEVLGQKRLVEIGSECTVEQSDVLIEWGLKPKPPPAPEVKAKVPPDDTPRVPAHVGENAAAASPPKKRKRKAKGGPVNLGTTIPQDATSTQTETVALIGQDVINERGEAALAFINGCGTHGATPHEVGVALGLDINQIRPVCTRLHQLGHMHRTLRTRPTPNGKPAHVYVGQEHWQPSDGERLSQAHRGIGQEVHPQNKAPE